MMKNRDSIAYVLLLGTLGVFSLPAAAGDCAHEWQFDCGNGACVEPYMVCDNADQCGNSADENDCTDDLFVCPPCAFACHNGTRCVSPIWVCDNDNDCRDGSDEKNCPDARAAALNCTSSTRPKPTLASPLKDTTPGDVSSKTSPPARSCNITAGGFPCLDGRCLLPVQVCDGVTDCSDGADEGRFCQLIQQHNQQRQKEKPQKQPQHQAQRHQTKQQQHGFRGWLLDLSMQLRMLFQPLQDSSNLTSRE
ncbi:hypothetical protein HPB50_020397 [Hyalomma asiaticum]|uniref:Uncharacterized protein n=1 Tax=Hyalomma asiaticum TaxID=266040 RepID=A0ACB7RPZ5_HYAAI|nr:hypothetical protein HPB50_020397 [Hyalomma asiaticum]